MNFDWFKICNIDEFEALNLVSKTYTLELEGLGFKDILVTKGNLIGVTYEGIFLTPNLNAKNPFIFDGHAAFISESNDLFLGIEVDGN